MQSFENVAPDERRAKDCFAEVRPELEAIARDQLLPLNVDASAVTTSALGIIPRLAEFRPELSLMPRFDLARFDRLETYVLALRYADSRHTMAVKPKDGLRDLAKEGAQLRQLLTSETRTLILRGVLRAEVLAGLRGGRGFFELSADLQSLAVLLDETRPKAAGLSGVTQEEIGRAARISLEMARTRGRRRFSREDIQAAAELRLRAFTRLMWTYEDAQRAIIYLCGRERDPTPIVPSLYGKRKRAKKAKNEPQVTLEPAAAQVAPTATITEVRALMPPHIPPPFLPD